MGIITVGVGWASAQGIDSDCYIPEICRTRHSNSVDLVDLVLSIRIALLAIISYEPIIASESVALSFQQALADTCRMTLKTCDASKYW